MKANANKLAYIGSKPGINNSDRDSDIWFTPEKYTKMVREVLGGIDLDPFSSAVGNQYVQANRYITVEEDAFEQVWFENKGSVFMNPPYARGLVNRAISAFISYWKAHHITEAIILVNNATETQWFQNALKSSSAICLPSRRIAFENNDGKHVSSNTRGQVFLYFGDNSAHFKDVFNRIGVCLFA
ncbi:MAG: DNA N-6-adenine-methyltransferase [Psychromonas sp.]